MKADAKTEAGVKAVMDKFMENYKQRNLEGLLALLGPDEDILMYGTGADEKRIGHAQFKFQAERDWSQTDELDFQFTWQHISAAGPVAWLAADGRGVGRVGDERFQFPLRITAVFEQRGDQWLMAQSHISLPAPAQTDGDSVPV